QRQGIGLPAAALAGGNGAQPVGQQGLVPCAALFGTTSIQIVEVVLVVAPQLVCLWMVPAQVAELARHAKEVECSRGKQTGFAGNRGLPVADWDAQAWGRGEVGARAVAAKPQAAEQLYGFEMAQRVPIEAAAGW